MLITWNEQSIGKFIEASEYTAYHKNLAAKIIPYLDKNDTMLDVGCGLGRLDLELSQHVAEILAVDVSESAIKALQQGIELTGAKNIRTRVSDEGEITETYDIILMSFFGRPDMSDFIKRSRRKLIRIVGAGEKSGLYPERHRRVEKNAVPGVRSELDALGVEYSLELCAIESGQPLRTWRDAEVFVLSNAPEADADEINEFLNAHIESTGREDFPLYLPYQKELGIFVIDKENRL